MIHLRTRVALHDGNPITMFDHLTKYIFGHGKTCNYIKLKHSITIPLVCRLKLGETGVACMPRSPLDPCLLHPARVFAFESFLILLL